MRFSGSFWAGALRSQVCPGLLMIQTSTGAAFGAYITDPLMLDAKQKTNASECTGLLFLVP